MDTHEPAYSMVASYSKRSPRSVKHRRWHFAILLLGLLLGGQLLENSVVLCERRRCQSIPARGRAEGLFSRIFQESHGPRTVSAVRVGLVANSEPQADFPECRALEQVPDRRSIPNSVEDPGRTRNKLFRLDRADPRNPETAIHIAYGKSRLSLNYCVVCHAEVHELPGVYELLRHRSCRGFLLRSPQMTILVRDKTLRVESRALSSPIRPQPESARAWYETLHGDDSHHLIRRQGCRAQCIVSKAVPWYFGIRGRGVDPIYFLPTGGILNSDATECQQAGGPSTVLLVNNLAPWIWSIFSFVVPISRFGRWDKSFSEVYTFLRVFSLDSSEVFLSSTVAYSMVAVLAGFSPLFEDYWVFQSFPEKCTKFMILDFQNQMDWRRKKSSMLLIPLHRIHVSCHSTHPCWLMLPRANEQTRGGCRLTWTRLIISGEHSRLSRSVHVWVCACCFHVA